MKKFSYLMVIGLIGTLFAMPLQSKAETATIVSNSNSGIGNATYTATFSDGTVMGFYPNSGTWTFVGAKSQKTSLTLPDTLILYSSSSINKYPLKRIGYYGVDFSGAQNVTSLTLPPTMTSIYDMQTAPNIKVLHATSYISSIQSSCLSELTKILVPESTLSSYLGNSNWYDYVLINAEDSEPLSVTINMTKPGELAQHILEQAGDWKKVNELTVTGELNSDDLLILHKLRQLTKLDLSNAIIDAIPDYSNDTGSGILETVLLPKIDFIGSYAFQYCRRLRSISLPTGITAIGYGAFQCSGLRNVEIPNSLKTINSYAFHRCSALVSVSIPSSVTTIGSNAFSYCTRLNSVSFAEGLLDLDRNSFADCTALTEVKLPSSLVFLDGAFSNCTSIKKVICRAATPPTHENQNNSSYSSILYGCDMTNVKLYVPTMSIDSYRNMNGWKMFYTILPLEEKLTNVYIYDDETIDDASQFDDDCTFRLGWRRQNRNGVTDYYCGAVDYNGSSILPIGNYRQYHYMGFANNSNPYSNDAIHTSLISNGMMSAENVQTALRTYSNRYWYFISLPYDVKVSDIIYPSGTQFVIRKYSGLNRANQSTNTWLNLTADSVMHAYEGYILKCNNTEYADFTFPAMNNSNKNRVFEKDDVVMPLNEYLSEFDHNRSWNLIGNPYPCYYDTRFMDFTAPITVWNRYNSRYDAYSPIDDSFILTPAQAFFVQRPVDKADITFNKEGRQKTSTARSLNMAGKRIASNRQLYNVLLTSGDNEDHTRFVFNDAASCSYELDKDASKLIAGDNTSMLVYTVEDGVRYAINERDYADGKIHLGFYAPEDGNYRLSLETNSTESVTLVDHESESQTSLSGEYSFRAKAGYNDTRFTLVFGQSGITELNNDNLLIDVSNGIVSANVRCKVYTIDGRMVGTCDAENSINLDKGIYVISGNNVTRKIIVK